MEQNDREQPWQSEQPVPPNRQMADGKPGEASGTRPEAMAAPASLLPSILHHLERRNVYLTSKVTHDELKAALDSPEWHIRAAAVKALASLQKQASLGLLAGALHDEHPIVRVAAVRAWGNMGNLAPLDPLITALNDPAWQVREMAALTLSTLGAQGQRIIAAPLVRALHDEDAAVREAAAMALRQARLDGVVAETTQAMPVITENEVGWQGNRPSTSFKQNDQQIYTGEKTMKDTRSPFENSELRPWSENVAGQIDSRAEYQPKQRSISRRRVLMGLGAAGTVAVGTAASCLFFSGRLETFMEGHGAGKPSKSAASTPVRAPSEAAKPAATVASQTDPYNQGIHARGVMFGFDAQHTRFNPYESILNTTNVSGLTQIWYSDSIGRNYFSSPVVSGDLIYVGSFAGRLYALDRTTGHIRWTSNSAGSSSGSNDSTPAVSDGMVYIGLQDQRLYAFDAITGNIRWISPAGHAVDSSPTVIDGVVYVIGQGRVYAFDAITGHIRWVSLPTSGATGALPSVAVANGVVYASTSGYTAGTGRISAFDAATGHTRWVSDLIDGGTDTNSSPTVANGLVYIGSGNGGLVAFDATNGHARWVTPATAGSTGSSPAVAHGVVYIAEDRVYAFDALTGHSHWVSNAIGAYNADSPIVANGVVYVCSAGNNSVYALNAATGKTLWISPPANGQIFTTPAVANGVVYLASGNSGGELYAFSLPG